MITAASVPGSPQLIKYDPESCNVPLKEAHMGLMLVYLLLGAANE